MKITRKGIASAAEGCLTTQKRFVYKEKNTLYIAKLIDGKTGVSVHWMERYRKV